MHICCFFQYIILMRKIFVEKNIFIDFILFQFGKDMFFHFI